MHKTIKINKSKHKGAYSRLVNQAVGTKPSLTNEGPTRTASRNKPSSAYLEDTSLKSIRPVSPPIKHPKTAYDAPKRPCITLHLAKPPPTPPGPPPAALPQTPPRASSPTHESAPLLDKLLIAALSQPYASELDDPLNSLVSTSQESSTPLAKPHASTSVIIPQKRPASPEIRPAKLLVRQKKL